MRETLPAVYNPIGMRLARMIGRPLVGNRIRGAWRLNRALARLILPCHPGEILAPTILGFPLYIDPRGGNVLETALYYDGIYEIGTIEVMRRVLRAGDVFIDAGANIGLLSLAASRLVGSRGRVLSFEPVAETYGILQRNIDVNAVANIKPFQMALGDAWETREIRLRPAIGRIGSFLADPKGSGGTERVEVAVLDDILEPERIAKCRMVKIDVEGWEYHVLQGGKGLLSGRDAPVLCVECSDVIPDSGHGPADVFGLIRSLNAYSLFRLRRGKESATRLVRIGDLGDLPHHDNVFCFLPHHMESLGPLDLV